MGDLSTSVPTSVTAGDTVQWTRALPAYPRSAGWVLSYALVSATALITITGSAGTGADDFAVTVDATTSAGWAPGVYTVQEYATQSGNRQTVGQYRITVLPNLAAATSGIDTRSQARRTLEAVNAVLEGRASEAELEVTINGRTLKYMPMADLLTLRTALRLDVAIEDRAAGLGIGPNLYVRFRA